MRIINKIGNEELLNREKSLFLCSKHAPYSVYDKVFGWVDSLTTADFCIGSSNNGWLVWKDKDGQTLDAVYRKQLE